jgi:GNAT superfamily N-acetyltransferase
MPDVRLRPLREEELAEASDLCLRSKAYWGYDQKFLEACRDELTLTRDELGSDTLVVAESSDRMVGVGQLIVDGEKAELSKLFIEPASIGRGIGKSLFQALREAAIQSGAMRLVVTADPQAVPFYRSVGFEDFGSEPSASISGRNLPVLAMDLPGHEAGP